MEIKCLRAKGLGVLEAAPQGHGAVAAERFAGSEGSVCLGMKWS